MGEFPDQYGGCQEHPQEEFKRVCWQVRNTTVRQSCFLLLGVDLGLEGFHRLIQLVVCRLLAIPRKHLGTTCFNDVGTVPTW